MPAEAANGLPQVLSSVVVVQQDESDWFLVNLDRGESVAVDRAEAHLFESCRKGDSLEAAAHELAALLELPPGEEAVLRRVRTALDHFREWGLCAT